MRHIDDAIRSAEAPAIRNSGTDQSGIQGKADVSDTAIQNTARLVTQSSDTESHYVQ